MAAQIAGFFFIHLQRFPVQHHAIELACFLKANLFIANIAGTRAMHMENAAMTEQSLDRVLLQVRTKPAAGRRR